MTDILEITPTQFCERWPDKEVTILDVRETKELELASLEGTKHMPMMEIPNRLEELSNSETLVIMCHSGGRSRRGAEFLLASGFNKVFNLTGGIDAWASEIDPTIPRY